MRPNVLLVVLDTVRARNTSLHGHVNETTPFLTSFADDATWYTQARAPAATSLTSHASIFTGLSVPEHGLTATDRSLEPGHSVFERLRDDGYRTGIFSENTWITEVDVGLDRGFEKIVGPQNLPFPDAVDPRGFVADAGRGDYVGYVRESLASDAPVRSLVNGVAIKLAYDYPALLPDALRSRARGDAYVDALFRWIDDTDGAGDGGGRHDDDGNGHSDGDEPWAACINLMDAHNPYEPPATHDHWGGERARAIQNDLDEQKWEFAGGQRPWWQKRALESLYDGAVRQADAVVAELVGRLRERGVYSDTLVVVTADHGEGFGERSHVRPDVRIAKHNVGIHEVLTHVPLLVKRPGQESGERVDDIVSLSAFPTAVERVQNREQSRDSATAAPDRPLFVRDGPVVSTAVGLNEAERRRAAPYVDDLSPYTATSRAVYERGDDGRVRKYVTWRDVVKTFEVPDPETSFVAADTDEGRVDAVFEDLTDAGVTGDGTAVDDLDGETRRHLEDLGYV